MKSTPSDLIYTFRKKIYFQTFFHLLLAASVIIILFLLKVDRSYLQGAIYVAYLILVIMAFHIIRRWIIFKSILDPLHPDHSALELEVNLEQQQSVWRGTYVIRFVVGTVLTIGMLLFIYYDPHSLWTGEIAMLWLGLILLSMLRGWNLMKDQIMLQDLKHSQRNHPSDVS